MCYSTKSPKKMTNQFSKNERKNRPQKISKTLGKITKNLISKFDKDEFIIHSKWDEMVGNFFSEYSEPIRLERNDFHSDHEFNDISKTVLHINIVSPAALEFQHLNNKIIDKINSFFGYKAVSKIFLHQVPYLQKTAKESQTKKIIKNLNEEQKTVLKKTTSGISSKKLEKALLKLGESIITRKK